MSKYLTIDVGGTAIKYAVMDEKANHLSKGETPTLRDNMEEFLGALDTIVLPVKDEVEGIAISLPGKIDNARGFAYTGGALSNFIMNTPVKDILEERYHLPVAIENDGKCAALAEAWLGNLSDVNSGVVVILGTGIGGGVVLDKKVWRGHLGSAGELSALPTNYNDATDMRSCWAVLNGYKGLTRPYESLKGLEKNEVDGRKFFTDLLAGDEIAKQVFDHFITTLTTGIISIQAVLDVEKFCIGGGISAQDILIDSLRDSVNGYFEKSPMTPLNKPLIDRCVFRNDANLIGALKNFFDQNA